MKVTLLPSGHSYDVNDGQTVLAAGLAAGYSMPYSCRTGTCRTCKGRVALGKVDFGVTLATYLPEAERAQGYALLCVAKPLTDLQVEVAELEGIESIQPKIYPCRLVKIEKPAPDVAILTLRMPPNENMRFMAGQYIEMITKSGERRPYSLSVPPNQEGLTFAEIHVRHVPGGLFTEVGEELHKTNLLNHWGIDVESNEAVDAAHKAALENKEKYSIRQVMDVVNQHGVYSFYIEDLDHNWWEIQHYDGFQHDDIFEFGDRF